MKANLDKVMRQGNSIFSLYSDVISCGSPATNYTVFLLERYLMLKIKFIKFVK